MRTEFDLEKDEINQAKHGISLAQASEFDWESALERVNDRFEYGEVRFVAIGLIGSRVYVMVFTEGSEEEALRIISLRPAEKREIRYYYAQV